MVENGIGAGLTSAQEDKGQLRNARPLPDSHIWFAPTFVNH